MGSALSSNACQGVRAAELLGGREKIVTCSQWEPQPMGALEFAWPCRDFPDWRPLHPMLNNHWVPASSRERESVCVCVCVCVWELLSGGDTAVSCHRQSPLTAGEWSLSRGSRFQIYTSASCIQHCRRRSDRLKCLQRKSVWMQPLKNHTIE